MQSVAIRTSGKLTLHPKDKRVRHRRAILSYQFTSSNRERIEKLNCQETYIGNGIRLFEDNNDLPY